MYHTQTVKDKLQLIKNDNQKEKISVVVTANSKHSDLPPQLLQEISQFLRYLKIDGFANAHEPESEEQPTNPEPKKRGRKKKN